MIGVDGSDAMRDAASATLAPYTERFDLRPFRLEDDAWLDAIAAPVRCFVSCLVIHHLDGSGKRALFACLYRHRRAPDRGHRRANERMGAAHDGARLR